LIIAKGKGKATYYIAGDALNTELNALNTELNALSTEPKALNTEAVSTPPLEISTPLHEISTPDHDSDLKDIPLEILTEINSLKQREHNVEKITRIIKKLCTIKSMNSHETAELFGKREDYIKRKFLGLMIAKKELKYLHPEMINHPEQAYLTNKKE